MPRGEFFLQSNQKRLASWSASIVLFMYQMSFKKSVHAYLLMKNVFFIKKVYFKRMHKSIAQEFFFMEREKRYFKKISIFPDCSWKQFLKKYAILILFLFFIKLCQSMGNENQSPLKNLMVKNSYK